MVRVLPKVQYSINLHGSKENKSQNKNQVNKESELLIYFYIWTCRNVLILVYAFHSLL